MADVKKGKPNRAASRPGGIVYATQEDLYERALHEMNTDSIIVQYQYKAETYLKAASMFDEVGDYLDAPQMAERCRELARRTGVEEKQDLLRKAVRLRDKGNEIHDLEKAAGMFEELGGFEGAEKEGELNRQKLKKALTARWRKQAAVLAVLALILAGIMTALFTGFYRYVLAFGYEKMGLTEKSQHIYADLGGLLDSRERAALLQEQMEREQDTEDFRALKAAKTGAKITFANVKWRILERDDQSLRLILETVERGDLCFEHRYQEPDEAGVGSAQQGGEALEWENSSLHRWMQTNELMTMFERDEAASLVPDENGEYFTMLTAREAEEYADILAMLSSRVFWLQDLTAAAGSDKADGTARAMFVIPGGAVMTEGYPVTEGTFSVRPVIRVDLETLEQIMITDAGSGTQESWPDTAREGAAAWEQAVSAFGDHEEQAASAFGDHGEEETES